MGRKDLDWKDKVKLLVNPPGWVDKGEEKRKTGEKTKGGLVREENGHDSFSKEQDQFFRN
jgi:hypothetical protein